MINKRCFLVTAYCNTSEKKEALKNTIINIKKYNIDIILFSHYPIEEDIHLLVDYSIYDYSNPISNVKDKSMINWKKLNKFRSNPIPFKLNTLSVDYGYAAAQQFKRGLLFASRMGYEEAIVLNYDLEVTDKMFNDFNKNLNKYDNIILKYGNDDTSMYMAWFALKIKPYIENIESISYTDYVKTEIIVENYLFKKFNSINSLIIPRKKWEGENPNEPNIKTSIVMEGDVWAKYNTDKFKWFIGQEKIWFDNDPEVRGTDKVILFFWDILEDLDVKIFINDKLVYKSFVYKKLDNQLIYMPILYDELNKPSLRLKIFINDWEIPEELIKLSANSAIEIAYADQ